MTNQMFRTSAFPALYIYIYHHVRSAVSCVILCNNDNAVTTDNSGLEDWLDIPSQPLITYPLLTFLRLGF